jgi:hypothetical protein
MKLSARKAPAQAITQGEPRPPCAICERPLGLAPGARSGRGQKSARSRPSLSQPRVNATAGPQSIGETTSFENPGVVARDESGPVSVVATTARIAANEDLSGSGCAPVHARLRAAGYETTASRAKEKGSREAAGLPLCMESSGIQSERKTAWARVGIRVLAYRNRVVIEH